MITDFETHGKELTRDQYTVGLHYFDVMMGLKEQNARMSPSLMKPQKLQITRKHREVRSITPLPGMRLNQPRI